MQGCQLLRIAWHEEPKIRIWTLRLFIFDLWKKVKSKKKKKKKKKEKEKKPSTETLCTFRHTFCAFTYIHAWCQKDFSCLMGERFIMWGILLAWWERGRKSVQVEDSLSMWESWQTLLVCLFVFKMTNKLNEWMSLPQGEEHLMTNELMMSHSVKIHTPSVHDLQ